MRRFAGAVVVCGLVATLTPGPAAASPGGGTGSLDAWRLTGVLLVGGGSDTAAAKSDRMAWCSVVHETVENYLAAAPWVSPPADTEAEWFEPMDHDAITYDQTAMLNTWRAAVHDPDPTPLDPFIADFCSVLHEDGWLAVPASIVNLITDPNDFIRIEGEGETTCEFGQVLLGSASHGYRWDTGAWVYGFGTDWRDVYDTFDSLVSSNIDLTCADIFEPGDISRVSELTPDTPVNVNPALAGLTQLDHWLWYDFSDPASHQIGPLATTVSALGFSWDLETTAWVDRVLWDVDCVKSCEFRGMAADFPTDGFEYDLDLPDTELGPAPEYSGGAESAEEAAFTHVYTELGEVTISAAAVWRGTYVITNNLRFGSATFPVRYDPVVVAGTHDMPVVSVRAELRNQAPPG